MPRDFVSSLLMIAFSGTLITFTVVLDMPDLFMWPLLIIAIILNILGIVGVVHHSRN